MQPVSVGRLDYQIIRLIHRQRRTDQRQARIADIAAEDKLPCFSAFRQPQLHTGGTKQVTNIGKPNLYAFRCFDTLRVAARAQQPQYARRVLGRIDRIDSGTTGARRPSVHPLCVGHLNVRRIHQHDPAEILRRPCCVDFSPEPILV